MPSYQWINQRSGLGRALELDASTLLSSARNALGDFISETDLFADSEGPLDHTLEEDTTVGEFASDGVVTIVDGASFWKAAADADEEEPAHEEPGAGGGGAGGSGGGSSREGRPAPKPGLQDLDPERDPLKAPDGPEGHDHRLGWGGTPGKPDQLSDLGAAARKKLLEINYVDLGDDGKATAAAFVLSANGALEPAPGKAVRATVELLAASTARTDSATVSHSHFARAWQTQTVGSGSAEVDVPLFFNFKTQYRHVSSGSGSESEETVYFQASQRLPKARITLDDLSVSDALIAKLTAALVKPASQQARALLDEFAHYGQFVAKDMQVGGRITLVQDRRIRKGQSASDALNEFKSAAGAALSAEGVPVDTSGALGVRVSNQQSARHQSSRESLDMTVRGGDGSAASSGQKLGTDWLPTLDPFQSWRITGFREGTVVPITEILPAELKAKVLAVLRAYFQDQLIVKDTRQVGNVDEKKFSDEGLSYDRRIVGMQFRWDEKMDGFCTSWSQDGKVVTSGWHGGTNPQKGNGSFTLQAGEELTRVDVTPDGDRGEGVILGLIFYTSKGRRLPTSGQYGLKGDNPWVMLTAGRVRGFCGAYNSVVDAFGLRYLDLATNTHSRDFLEILEPYMFEA